MIENVLVVIKPDGMSRGLVGHIFNKLGTTKLDLVAARLVKVGRPLAEEHYRHIKGQSFYKEVIEFLMGKYHKQKKVLALVYRGKDAIKKCRKIGGATNPEEADPLSIRGAFGRITSTGVFENLIHVSSSKKEAEREIKLWFQPDEIDAQLYSTKTVNDNSAKKRVWA